MSSKPSWLRRPSTYTPFLRRFTDERAHHLKETVALYEAVWRRYRASRWAGEDAIFTHLFDPVTDVITQTTDRALPLPVRRAFVRCYVAIAGMEEVLDPPPEIDWNTAVLSLKDLVDLRHRLRAHEHFLANDETVTALIAEGLTRVIGGLMDRLPNVEVEDDDGALFSLPLVSLFPDHNDAIDRVIGSFMDDRYVDAGVFVALRRRFYENTCAVSGVVPDILATRPLRTAPEAKLPPVEAVNAYLKGTPFAELFATRVPLPVTQELFFEHMHVVAGSGSGKTQWLQSLVLHHLAAENRPCIVIVDSQGDMISKISQLAAFAPDEGELADRLVLITPKDIRHPPAINIFDVGYDRLSSYDELTREQVVAGAIQTFDYLFSGLLGADLTAKQSVFFRFVARLLISLPETMGRNATILDMLDLMDDHLPYMEAIERLPEIPRRFFKRDFPDPKAFKQTREQIRYRLNAILENPTFARLFTSPRTRVNLFDELNKGSIILIDTAKDFLKDASPNYGRIFISLVLQAILERAAIPEAARRPAFLIVDEAAEYFDSNIDDMLSQVRKYRCGCVFAHQYLDQATPSLRASLAANTAIKMATSVSAADARALAAEMHCTSDFILGQPKLSFATYIRNVTPQAVSTPVEAGKLEAQPRMSARAYALLRERNRERVSIPPQLSPEPPPPGLPAAEPAPEAAPVARPQDEREDGSSSAWG